MSSIEDAILKPVIKKIDKLFLKILQDKIDFCVGSIVAIVRAVEAKYGDEGFKLCKKAWTEWQNEEWRKLGVKKNDFRTFIELLEKSCIGSNDFKRVVDKKDYVGYNFTRCMWANAFRRMNAQDIGNWLCESDYVFPKAFNKNIGFKRSETLMEGKKLCDHAYFLKGAEEKG